ncbi:MAG: type II toxin-antitoxin system VapC family toxin [Caldilineaceae bacterium]
MAIPIMILCDTNILIEFYKNNHSIIQHLREIGPENIVISAITQAELYYGALNKRELQRIKSHLLTIQILPIDNNITSTFIQLMETYALSHKLSLPDALIGATALVHNLELYTLNLKDFRYIQGLSLYAPNFRN